MADRTSSSSSLLAGGCSGHALAQAVDLGELGDVVDLATSGQAIFCFIYFGLAGKVLFLNCKKKKTDGCDFGLGKNRMDMVQFGGITRIDDMACEKIFPDSFKRNRLELKFYGFGKNCLEMKIFRRFSKNRLEFYRRFVKNRP